MNHLDRLLDISRIGGGGTQPPATDAVLQEWGRLGAELQDLLERANGFYAFESALHVYGLTVDQSTEVTLSGWNDRDSWKFSYGDLATGYLFFGEDVFGNQFAIDRGGVQVVVFDPETAEVEALAGSLDEWAKNILDDAEYLTGYPLAHAWQKQFGKLAVGDRLLPKLPFVAGGEFDLQNLYSMNAITGMRLRGEIARQIKTLPDGARVTFRTE